MKKPLIIAIVALIIFILLGVSKYTGYYMLKTPENMDFETDQILIKVLVKEGESASIPLRITNIADKKISIKIDTIGLKNIVSIDQNNFELNKGGKKAVHLNFSSYNKLDSTEYVPDVYVGQLLVSSGDKEIRIPVIVEIESGNVLFDMNINPGVRNKDIHLGESMTIEVRLYNLAGFDPVDVNIFFSIKDLRGNSIITESESVIIETQASFFKTFKLPKDMDLGNYIFASKVNYGNSTGTSSYLFEIVGNESVERCGLTCIVGKYYYLGGVIMVFPAAIAFFFIFRRLRYQTKKFLIEKRLQKLESR